MWHRSTSLWVLAVVFPLIIVGILTYSLNRPPSATDVQRAFSARAHLDRLIPLDNQLIALSHTATTFNHAVIVRRWGAVEMLQSGEYGMTNTPTGNAAYSYQPIFLPLHTAQLLQGRVSTPTITSVLIRLDDGEQLRDFITDAAFGIVYAGDQGLCSLELLDAQQRMVEWIVVTPYAPIGADEHAYDCKP